MVAGVGLPGACSTAQRRRHEIAGLVRAWSQSQVRSIGERMWRIRSVQAGFRLGAKSVRSVNFKASLVLTLALETAVLLSPAGTDTRPALVSEFAGIHC